MSRRLLTLALFALGVACSTSEGTPSTDDAPADATAPGPDAASPDDQPRGEKTDGFYRVTVAQPRGTDEVWLAAFSPPGDGPLPVVVFARGKGLVDLANCAPTGGPKDAALATDTLRRTRAIADLGYLAVAVAYRNVGDGAPSGDAFKPRDEDTFDTRTLLAAAQWARRQHRRGSSRVAFVGTSMGTWPAFWAASNRADSADLRAGLDIRTVILTAETASHLSNAADDDAALSSPNVSERAVGVLGITTRVVLTAAKIAQLDEVTDASFDHPGPFRDAIASSLTPQGIALARALLTRPAPEGEAACDHVRSIGAPASCAPDCAAAVFEGLLPPGAKDIGPASDWLTSVAIDAFGYFHPPQVDPGPGATNPLLAALRAGSPALAAEGFVAPRALSLLSESDTHYDAAAERVLVDKLRSLGATVPEPPPITADAEGPCGHDDYHEPSRSCGFDLIRNELAAAF